jgi:uncharacterized protein (TIGR00290 family)
MKTKAILSWSSGKDSAHALYLARERGEFELAGLLTTVNEVHARVAIHGVRQKVLRAQAEAVGLPLIEVLLPDPCPNSVYERRMAEALEKLRGKGIRDFVFGDIHLEDVRAYREAQLARAGLRGHFPLWGRETGALAREMLGAGTLAHVVSLDAGKLPRAAAGAVYDAEFLASLPPDVDACGENGEFHTVVADGPAFLRPVPLVKGAAVERDGYVYCDFSVAPEPAPA